MGRNPQIHWHEGLLLQPHHLQYMQHVLHSSMVDDHKLVFSYPYGVIDVKLSYDALENMLIQFDRLHVIMPSGVQVSVPDNCDLPSLDISKVFKSGHGAFAIYIGVPLWYESRANTIEPYDKQNDWRVKRIFRVNEVERHDENSGKSPQPIMVRKINARLVLDDDDQSDLEVLPLLSICHAAGEDVGKPKLDANFIPPSLVLNGSPVLRELIRDLVNQIEATRKELLAITSHSGFSVENLRGIQFSQLLRLRTLSRYSARLSQLINAPNIPPFKIYLDLRELLAELSSLEKGDDQFEAASYDHDVPAPIFKELATRIRSLLSVGHVPTYKKIDFELADKVLRIKLTDEDISAANEYFLGIKSKEDPTSLAQLVEDQDRFKLMSGSLVKKAIWGVQLAEERFPPMGLPAQIGLSYFRLRLTGDGEKMWENITSEKEMAVRWPGMENSDFEISLYMTIPQE